MGIGSLVQSIESMLHLGDTKQAAKPASAPPAQKTVDTTDHFVPSRAASASKAPQIVARAGDANARPAFVDGDYTPYKDFAIKTVSYTVLDKMTLESAQKKKDDAAIASAQTALNADYDTLDYLRSQGDQHADAWGRNGFDEKGFWRQQDNAIPARDAKPGPKPVATPKPGVPASPTPGSPAPVPAVPGPASNPATSTPNGIVARFNDNKSQLDQVYNGGGVSNDEYNRRLGNYSASACQNLLSHSQRYTFDDRKGALDAIYNGGGLSNNDYNSDLSQLTQQALAPVMANQDLSFDARKASLDHIYNGGGLSNDDYNADLAAITQQEIAPILADHQGKFDDRKNALDHIYNGGGLSNDDYNADLAAITQQEIAPILADHQGKFDDRKNALDHIYNGGGLSNNDYNADLSTISQDALPKG